MCLRLTLGHEIGQSKAKYRCLENIFLRFSSLFSANDGKIDWTLRIKLELRTFLYDICHYDIQNKGLHSVLIHLIQSIICQSLKLYGLLASLKMALYSWTLLFYWWIFSHNVWQQNPIAVKVEADTQSFDVERTFEAPTHASTASADCMPLHPSTRSWEISRRQVNIVKVIGKGAFSQVAKATVNNMRGSQDNLTVAVKMLKGIV